MKFNVTVSPEGRESRSYMVEAPREGLAETRAQIEWLRENDANGGAPLRGELVEYEVVSYMRRRQNCVACGRLSESRWCSDSCFRSEDGHDCDYDEIDDDE